MTDKDKLIAKIETEFEQYEIIDNIYNGRVSRMLYTNDRGSMLSGIALDGIGELLFDYNERFMEIIRGLHPRRVLLIGGGAFSLPTALNKEFPNILLDVVEIDSALTAIAIEYFDYKPNPNTKVISDAGETYLSNSKNKYDLIVLDVFSNNEVPSAFQSSEIVMFLKQNINKNGLVAMNIISAFHGIRSAALERQKAAFKASFKYIELFPNGSSVSLWLPQNFILTAANHKLDLGEHMRYPRIDAEPIGLGSMRTLFKKINRS
jgi:spermidine synthase